MRNFLVPIPLRSALLALLVLMVPAAARAEIAKSPTEVRPLLLGTQLPDAAVKSLEGKATTLRKVVDGRPAMIVFYRGGWCPYCNLQLQGLRLIHDRMDALGFQMIAISPDRPEVLRESLGGSEPDFLLLSDASAQAMQAFGLAFRVDKMTLAKYLAYGIDLEAASGETHHALPVPGVFLVDGDGTLQFSYVHPDYKVRVPEEVIVAAAEALKAERQKLELRRKR